MKLKKYVIPALFSALFISCANERGITGGPKDITPPKLVRTLPSSKNNTNYKGRIISFEFDEYIKVQGFNSEVYITPKVENIGYEIDKNRLIIEFEEELAPNTTYNIQLGNCVRDITENNKSQGITLAFSTGNQLDSLKLIGKASNYLDGSTLNNQLIGLYDTKDTLNIDNSSPLYYTYTNTSGDFQMKHLKKGTYFVYAIGDKNKNKKYNKGEGIDFIPQEISIENYQDSILDFRIFKESHNPNQITNIRQQENWVLIKTRRGTEKIDAKGCYSVISEDGKSIKLYNQSFEVGKDYSISLNITDSLNRTIDSNFVINYKDFPVKKKDLMTSKSTEMYFTNNLEFSLFFSEPINIDTTKLIIENKGKTYQLSKNDIKLKNGNTILEISKKEKFTDSTYVFFNEGIYTINNSQNTLSDTLLFQEQNIESFSSLGGEVITIYEKYTIQLINKKGEVVDEQKDVKKFSFQKIRPGTYYLRVLIDENKDGIFERGSLLDKVRPEKVHQHPQKIILKANWEINDEKIIF